MGLSWQQGPLASGAAGRFLVPGPLPERMLFAEPLRRRMRVRFGGEWISDSEDVVLLHEPGRYPVAYFPLAAVADGVLEPSGYTTDHPGLGPVTWYTVRAGGQAAQRGAWLHTGLPGHASELKERIAFGWRAMDAYAEVGRISGLISFEPDRAEVLIDGTRLRLEPGQAVVPHGIDRDLTLDEAAGGPSR